MFFYTNPFLYIGISRQKFSSRQRFLLFKNHAQK